MRRKQVLALLLSGALTVGMAPAAAFAAEEASTVSIEEEQNAGLETAAETAVEPEVSAEGTSDEVTGTPAEAPTADPTEVPAETPAAEPTEVPAETPAADPAEVPAETPAAETPVAETPVADPSQNLTSAGITETPTPTETPAAGIFTIGENSYATLSEAIEAATATPEDTDGTLILVNENVELDAAVTIPNNKNVTIAAAVGKNITISRKEGFTGNLFEVKGGTLSLGGAVEIQEDGEDGTNNGTLTVNGAGTGTAGSLVSVSDDGMFNLLDYATLTGNTTTANGSAVNCASGIVTLGGGTITGNSTTGEGGAVYSNATVYVGGTVNISNNTGANGAVSNIVLNNDAAVTDPASAVTVSVLDKLSGSAIGIKLVNPDVGVPAVVVASDIEDMTPADALAQFTYDDTAYALDENGALKSTSATETPTPTPAQTKLEASITKAEWASTNRVKITGTSNKDGEVYIKVVKKGSTAPTADAIIAAGKKAAVTANKDFSISYTLTTTEKEQLGTSAITVYICVKDADGNTVVKSTDMNMETRPAKLTGVSAEWTGRYSATVVFQSDKEGTYYWTWVERGSDTPSIDECNVGSTVAANMNVTLYANDLDTENNVDVYIYVKGNDNTVSTPLVAQLSASSRPASATPTVTPSREPRNPAVTESVVTGLEEPLEFYPNTFYEFTVVGAGTDNTDPVEGDTRWVPLYWSTSSNPDDSEKHSTWKIGAKSGIKDAATYNLYIFYRQDRYNGNAWQPTDNITSVTYQFSSAAIDISATATPTPAAGYYYDENGNLVERTDDTTDTGSSTASNADTADESPIGTMSMLAMLSLLAGGYVITRKRKKITND